MRKVLPLKGYKSMIAMKGCGTLIMGLYFLPLNLNKFTELKEFYESFKSKTDAEKESLIRQAAWLVELSKDEVDAMLSFCCDKNGIEYSEVNLANLGPDEIHECVVSVCMALSRIEINLVTEAEKKKLQILA